MFDSISDEEIAENKGKTFQDITALRDPLVGLGYGDAENPFDLATDDEITVDYSPDQPRDKDGKWTGGGLTETEENGKIENKEDISATGCNEFKQGFTENNLERHIKKHGQNDYPDFTKEEYNSYALDLIQQAVSDDVLEYKTEDGAVVRYRVSTNDFVKGYHRYCYNV